MAEEVKLNDAELEEVSGGARHWSNFSKGTFVNYGSYIIYTIAKDDALSGIAFRFGVTVEQIAQWNNIKNVNLIRTGDKLTIYPTIIR